MRVQRRQGRRVRRFVKTQLRPIPDPSKRLVNRPRRVPARLIFRVFTAMHHDICHGSQKDTLQPALARWCTRELVESEWGTPVQYREYTINVAARPLTQTHSTVIQVPHEPEDISSRSNHTPDDHDHDSCERGRGGAPIRRSLSFSLSLFSRDARHLSAPTRRLSLTSFRVV